MPTLVVVDNANGTATATISGTNVSASNVVYRGNWTGGLGAAAAWTSGGSRTGDGAVTLTLSNGYYWAYVLSTLSNDDTASVPTYFRVTSGTDAILKQILDGVVTRIQSLTLAAVGSDPVQTVPADNIKAEKVPQLEDRNMPAIRVTPSRRTTMNPAAGTNLRDDIDYPVLVQIFDADNKDRTQNLGTYLKWHEQIAKAFRNQLLPGVSEVYLGFVATVDTVDERTWASDKRLFVSGIELHFMSREPRGLT